MKANWRNQTIWTGDNLDIMRGMNSASVDLIYLDPPFNSNANYAAPIGSQAAGAAFKDTWGLDDVNLAWHGEVKHERPGLYDLLNATRRIHGDSMMSYLIYMAIRVMEMRRLLKADGSIYLHCDSTASHYLKLLMDAVFGWKNFRNEVVWSYNKWTNAARYFQRNHDTLLFYSKGDEYDFNKQYWMTKHKAKITARGWDSNKVSGGIRQLLVYDRQRAANEINNPKYDRVVYLDDKPAGTAVSDVWHDVPYLASRSKERLGYPTQKPLALLKRIIKASSDPDDMVLDPFCGCATACIAAEMEARRWVGIDISPKAAELVQDRMRREVGIFFRGAHRSDIPQRTDLGRVLPYNAPQNRRHLYGEQGGYCNGCGGHFEMRNMSVDHIIPQAKGGTHHISNLQLLCAGCNSLKGTKSQAELLVRLTDKGWIKRRHRPA